MKIMFLSTSVIRIYQRAFCLQHPEERKCSKHGNKLDGENVVTNIYQNFKSQYVNEIRYITKIVIILKFTAFFFIFNIQVTSAPPNICTTTLYTKLMRASISRGSIMILKRQKWSHIHHSIYMLLSTVHITAPDC